MIQQVMCRFALILLAALTLACGCAKVPDSGSDGDGSTLIEVTVRFRGAIRTSNTLPDGTRLPNYYFVLLNRTDTISDSGPVPVVSTPWGNGFAAAAQAGEQGFVGMVVFSEFGGLSGYSVYRVPEDSDGNLIRPENTGTGLTGFVNLGQPDTYTVPQEGERTLTFRLDLSRLPNPNTRYLQINFLATNNLPSGADPNSPKDWDALGDGADTGSITSYITLDVTQSPIRTNSDTNLEPTNDVRDHLGPIVDDASLDIEDWSVTVRTQ